jgi:S-adenosylmethionine synthetase
MPPHLSLTIDFMYLFLLNKLRKTKIQIQKKKNYRIKNHINKLLYNKVIINHRISEKSKNLNQTSNRRITNIINLQKN